MQVEDTKELIQSAREQTMIVHLLWSDKSGDLYEIAGNTFSMFDLSVNDWITCEVGQVSIQNILAKEYITVLLTEEE